MKKILSICLLLFMVLINLSFVNALPAEISMVFASPGENASTEINISWHATIATSTLVYTTKDDTSYTNGISVTPTTLSTTFESFSDGNSGGYTGTVNYYRNTVNLTSLAIGTEYRYKIIGSTTTNDYFFKTADDTDSFSFIYMSDIHAYPNISDRLTTANSLVSKAEEKNSNLDFVLFSGDLTSHGSDYYQWNHFSSAPFTKNYFIASVPGNHDYYKHSGTTIHTSDVYYNAMFNNPKNGATEIQNSSYYFKYNNVLFVGINSEILDFATRDKQKSWLSTTIQNNPSEYIIAFSHREFFHGSTASAPAGVAKSSDNYAIYGSILESLGVDLVLTGDDHVYVRTKPILNGNVTTPDKGTVYITSNQIGSRGRIATASSQYSEVVYGGTTADNAVSSIQIINVSPTKITGEMFDTSGTVHDEYTIPCKREDIGDFNRDAYANSFNFSINSADLTLGKLTFTNNGYDKVRDIKVCNDANDYVYTSIEPTENMTEYLFGPIVAGRTFELKLIITFKDSTKREVLQTFVNKEEAGAISNLRVEDIDGTLFFKWDNTLISSQIRDFDFEIDGDLISHLDFDETEYSLAYMLTEGENTLSLIVTDIYNQEIFNETLTYNYNPNELTPPVEEAPKSGCKTSAVNLLFIFVGFGLILIKRKEII